MTEPTITRDKETGHHLLSVGPFPIITVKSYHTAVIVWKYIETRLEFLPDMIPADIAILAGLRVSQVVSLPGISKYSPIRARWTSQQLIDWQLMTSPQTKNETTTIVDEGQLYIALAQGGTILGDVSTE